MKKDIKMNIIFTLAALVIQEALRTRFFTVLFLWLLIGFGFALFIGQVAIIESGDSQSSLLSAFLRLGAVFVMSLFVIDSMVQEFKHNIIFVWLSLPLPRSWYLIGKFSGFMLVAAMTTIFNKYGYGRCPYFVNC